MATTHSIQDIGFQHGVVRNTAQRDAVICKHISVVLEVLTYLFNIGRLK